MARTSRHKSKDAAYYHLINRAAGAPDYYPFHTPETADKLLSLFELYLQVYCCRLAALQLMGNHYHAIVYFEKYRRLSHKELTRRAQLRFGDRWELVTQSWSKAKWQQFNRDLFDVSKFMQHVNGEFAKWFNRRYQRRGPFWADRFKNPELMDLKALQTTLIYVELNAIRAGLAQRPEDYIYGSAYWRRQNKKSWLLIPLEEIFPPQKGRDSYSIYREHLYEYGAIATRDNEGVIPEAALEEERQHGFSHRGLFRRRKRFFSDGVAIGARSTVATVLQQYRDSGRYQRRKNPIEQLGGWLFSLREQRSHARNFQQPPSDSHPQ